MLSFLADMFSPSGGGGGFSGGSPGKSPWKAKGEISKSKTNFTSKHMSALIGSDEQAISTKKPQDMMWAKVINKTNKAGEQMLDDLPDLLVNTAKGTDHGFTESLKDICKIGPYVSPLSSVYVFVCLFALVDSLLVCPTGTYRLSMVVN